MYCSSCGAALAQGLRYCNRCGAKLMLSADTTEKESPHIKLAEVAQYVSVATGFIGLGGLFLIVILVRELLKRGVETSAIVLLTVLSLLIVFGISALLIRQLSSVLGIYLQSGSVGESEKLALSGQTAALEESSEPVPSVIEHTTRTLEPSYRERKT